MIEFLIASFFLVFLIITLVSIFRGAPFVGIDRKSLKKMIELSEVKKGEKVIDLGSGDGRVVVAIAEKGIEAHGVEINPFLVLISRMRIRLKVLQNRAHIHWGSMWSKDLSEYDVVVIFGISYMMARFEKKLKKETKKGTRVICYSYSLPNLKPENKENGVYLYIIT